MMAANDKERSVEIGSKSNETIIAPEMKTSSRIKAWYLVQFRGYTVTQRREIPKVTRLGRLTYECQWHLRARISPDSLT